MTSWIYHKFVVKLKWLTIWKHFEKKNAMYLWIIIIISIIVVASCSFQLCFKTLGSHIYSGITSEDTNYLKLTQNWSRILQFENHQVDFGAYRLPPEQGFLKSAPRCVHHDRFFKKSLTNTFGKSAYDIIDVSILFYYEHEY